MWHEQQQELSKNAGHGRSGWAGRARAAGEAVRAERDTLSSSTAEPVGVGGQVRGGVKRGEARARSGRG